MPVLVESNSVIVCRDAIDARMQGGWDGLFGLAPAATLCTDGEIVRVGFDEFEAMVEFLSVLQRRGLRYGVSPSEDDMARSGSRSVRTGRTASSRRANGSCTCSTCGPNRGGGSSAPC